MDYGLVIIGAGQAAAQCAMKAREKGYSGRILVIGEEAYLPYQRPPLSKKYLSGELNQDGLLIYPAVLYESKQIEFKLKTKVVAIDATQHSILTDQQETIHYQHLVIATGSRPNQLPEHILPANLNNVFVFRGMNDCHDIQGHLQTGKTLLILGGGYIGLELAAVAKQQGLNVVVVEKSPRILQRVACQQTSDYIRKVHQQQGVIIKENSQIVAFHQNEQRLTAIEFDTGEQLAVDLMVVGIGVTANYELAEACGVHIQQKTIVVNEQCQTNVADIFAIGDCTSFQVDGQFMRLESVQNANEQADVVASVLNQQHACYQPTPWFWSDQFHLKLQIAGVARQFNQVVARIDEQKRSASFWYLYDQQLQAVDAINDPKAFMLAKKHLGQSLQDPSHLANLDRDLKNIWALS